MTNQCDYNKIIVFGEAPESDDEESTNDEVPKHNQKSDNASNNVNKPEPMLSITPSSIMKFLKTSFSKDDLNPASRSSDSNVTSMSLLQRTLYNKNQHLRQCLGDLNRRPYEKASENLHLMSQNLVDVQKVIQNIDSSLIKLRRDINNLDCNVMTL